MSTKLAADVSDFRLAFPDAAGREADFVEGFLKRAHEICGHSIEGTPDLPQALLSIAIAEKLASTPEFLDGFTKRLETVDVPGR